MRVLFYIKDLLRGGQTLLAHNLLPAFITYVGDGISGLLSVLERLTGSAAGSPARGAGS